MPPQLREHVFKPGQIANPGGRPKGSGTFAGELASILGEEVEDLRTGEKSTRRRVAAERIADLLSAGDLQAWAVVLRYCPEVLAITRKRRNLSISPARRREKLWPKPNERSTREASLRGEESFKIT